MDFKHVDVWIFDLDNTLYPPEMALFPQIEERMTAYVMRLLEVDAKAADRLRRDYWSRHGTTLAGLMAEHGIDPIEFLDEVHDIDFTPILPAPELAAAIAALPGRKIIHTNADAAYAVKVLRARGMGLVDDRVPAPLFEAIYGIGETEYCPKPQRAAFETVISCAGLDPEKAAFFEDDPRNLRVPHEMGMRTVLVGPGRDGPEPLGASAPGYVDHHVHDLTGFLLEIYASLKQ
ncbi:pyrimidine 5'-nucleotidase [Paracoccus caeni]|uniref:Pyrimidine 5'-nucleotidase n=2 Tax=Paracoccus caeni TaxID=657651 RepID=A0A934SC69_9RHOB|nr:pyrimidine 5'-nucleotidase [Paracoccus caeni]MBK4214599.1 pyrimidine 5'-nucleotidase [Paracoccus caeni]